MQPAQGQSALQILMWDLAKLYPPYRRPTRWREHFSARGADSRSVFSRIASRTNMRHRRGRPFDARRADRGKQNGCRRPTTAGEPTIASSHSNGSPVNGLPEQPRAGQCRGAWTHRQVLRDVVHGTNGLSGPRVVVFLSCPVAARAAPNRARAGRFSAARRRGPARARLATIGAPDTNRTYDLPLRRGLLYPLSYRGAIAILTLENSLCR